MEKTAKHKNKKWALLFLVLLAPVMGELLSGSSPPNEFFTPFGFIVMTLLYGGGALLIREARVRWQLGWSIVFLAIAYGILEEGLLMQSFFNHNHIDLEELAGYGMFLKCQWPWAIELTIYHATVSTLLPIMATDLLFPDLANEPFLKKPGIISTIVLLALDTIVMAAFVIITYSSVPHPYVPSALNLFVWTLITFALIYMSYRLREKRYADENVRLRSPFNFAVKGFLFVPIVIITPYVFANFNAPAAIAVAAELAIAYWILHFAFRQISHRGITVRHKAFLFAGVIISFSVLAAFSDLVNHNSGMLETGIACTALLIVYCTVVLKREKKPKK